MLWELRLFLFDSTKSCKYHQTLHIIYAPVMLKVDNQLLNDWEDGVTGVWIPLLTLLIMINP